MHRIILSAVLLTPLLTASTATYYSQSQWQAATTSQSAVAITDISFASADWTDSFQASRSFDSLASISTDAASNGMAVSAISGYSPLGVANNALLGHVSNGEFTDTISKYGSTTFNFADPVYGFGGNFDIAGANGLDIVVSGSETQTPKGIYDGFVGLTSSVPFSSITITWGETGDCTQVFGNSYTLADLQVGTGPVATPEPNFKYAFAALLVLVTSFHFLRRSSPKST